jgi:hypothetical protein
LSNVALNVWLRVLTGGGFNSSDGNGLNVATTAARCALKALLSELVCFACKNSDFVLAENYFEFLF